MSIEAIAAVSAPIVTNTAATGSSVNHASSGSFIRLIDEQLASTDAKIRQADASVQSLALGKADNLHRVMMDVESARLSLDLVVQVRNRVVEAYQDLMRMQL